VDTTQLRHRIVAVFEEHAVIQLLGAAQSDGGVDGDVAGDVEVADELVEEQPSQALGRPAVAGEQRPFDHFGQVDQRKHRPVEVREVPPEDVRLVRLEVLGDVHGHRVRTLPAASP
jgi:hypothetical protein